MRKLFVTSIVVFIKPGSTTQLLAGILFAAFGWGITAYARPYTFKVENKLQQISLASITFTLTLCAISQTQLESSDPTSSVLAYQANEGAMAFGLIISAISIYVASAVILYLNFRNKRESLTDMVKEKGRDLKRRGSMMVRGNVKGNSDMKAMERRMSSVEHRSAVASNQQNRHVETAFDGVVSFQKRPSGSDGDNDSIYDDGQVSIAEQSVTYDNAESADGPAVYDNVEQFDGFSEPAAVQETNNYLDVAANPVEDTLLATTAPSKKKKAKKAKKKKAKKAEQNNETNGPTDVATVDTGEGDRYDA